MCVKHGAGGVRRSEKTHMLVHLRDVRSYTDTRVDGGKRGAVCSSIPAVSSIESSCYIPTQRQDAPKKETSTCGRLRYACEAESTKQVGYGRSEGWWSEYDNKSERRSESYRTREKKR